MKTFTDKKNTESVHPATMLVKRKHKSGPSYIVLSRSRLAGDFDKHILNNDILKVVGAVFDNNEIQGTCQLAYEGDIVISCLGDWREPTNYKAHDVVRKVQTDGEVDPTNKIIQATLKQSSLPMNIVMLCCKSPTIGNYFTNLSWKPTPEFLLSGMTIREMRAKRQAQRRRTAKAK